MFCHSDTVFWNGTPTTIGYIPVYSQHVSLCGLFTFGSDLESTFKLFQFLLRVFLSQHALSFRLFQPRLQRVIVIAECQGQLHKSVLQGKTAAIKRQDALIHSESICQCENTCHLWTHQFSPQAQWKIHMQTSYGIVVPLHNSHSQDSAVWDITERILNLVAWIVSFGCLVCNAKDCLTQYLFCFNYFACPHLSPLHFQVVYRIKIIQNKMFIKNYIGKNIKTPLSDSLAFH